MISAGGFGFAALALGAEAVVTYPAFLQRRFGHPVCWIGDMITATEVRFNRPSSPAKLQNVCGIASLLSWLVSAPAPRPFPGFAA